MNKRRQTLKYIVSDFLTAIVVWLLFNLLRYSEVAKYDFSSLSDYLLFYQVIKGQILIPLFWLFIYFLSGYYNKPFGKLRIGELFTTFISITTGTVLIFFIVLLNDLPESFQIYYKLFFALFGLQFLLTYAGRIGITNHALRKTWKHEWFKNVIVIGKGQNAEKVKRELQDSEYNIVGFVNENEDIANMMKERKIDEIILASDNENITQLLYNLYRYRCPIKVALDKNSLLSKIKVKNIYSMPFVDVTENNFSEAEKNIKLLMDKVIALSVLVLLSPLYLYISLKVKADSKGAVFFRQERIGYRGKPFTILKFRTMYADSDKQGPLLTERDDKRVTKFGRFLRKYRLDEIPQFWNVLKGDMSLVGPRPEQRYYINRIVEKAPYYYLLHNVRPGITSLGMVKYGYADTVDKMIERLNYDILYYENMSLMLDITILIYTVKTVFTGKGV
ncbi:MAG: sugar transferase [Tannerella sp.]|jgi:exopolysaccharide biosynthesis polyprenyl glycosylphosphotransferase|nr:sugar transferase [Tannerella sp.]